MTNEAIKDLWNRAKELLKEETSIITYETWIQPLEIKSINDNVIVLLATNPYQREKVENMYLDLITNTFNFLTNKKCQIFIKLTNEDLRKFKSIFKHGKQ